MDHSVPLVTMTSVVVYGESRENFYYA